MPHNSIEVAVLLISFLVVGTRTVNDLRIVVVLDGCAVQP
jgi:hypothetical protein